MCGALAASVPGLSQLGVDFDPMRLLPADAPSVQAMHRLRRASPTGSFDVMITGGDVSARREAAEAIALDLADVPGVAEALARHPSAFFSERGLYYASNDVVQSILRSIEARLRWEEKLREPQMKDFPRDLEPTAAGLEILLTRVRQAPERVVRPFIEDPAQTFVIVRVRPVRNLHLAEDVQPLRDAINRRVQSRLQGTSFHGQVGGTPVALLEVSRRAQRDATIAAVIALVSGLLLLAVYFRSARNTLAALLPLAVGLVVTGGIVGWRHGAVNALSAGLGTIIIGVGFDHGIHIVASVRSALRRGENEPEIRGYADAAPAVAVAALTTVAAFLPLGGLDSVVLNELATIGVTGVSVTIVAYLVLMPVLVRARDVRDPAVPERFAYQRRGWPLAAATVVFVLAALAPRVGFDMTPDVVRAEDLSHFEVQDALLD